MNELMIHPEDADLLMLLDRELSSVRRQEVRDHVDSCPRCRDALHLFEAGTASVADLLTVNEAPRIAMRSSRRVSPPSLAIIKRPEHRSWHARPSLRAAIIVLGLGVTMITVAPVRAWVGDLIVTVVGGANNARIPAPVEQKSVQQLTTSSIAFVPTSLTFEISLATQQVTGALTIVPGPGVRAQGSVTGTSNGSALLVIERGIRITNSPTSTASYRIQIPASVRVVEVSIAGRRIATINRAALTTTTTISLADTDRESGTNAPR